MFSQRNVYDMSNFVTFVYYVYVNYVMLKICYANENSWGTGSFPQVIVFDYWFEYLKDHIKYQNNKETRLYFFL